MGLTTKGLYFTPIAGKRAFLPDWPKMELSYGDATGYVGCTGVGIVHALSGTACADIDDIDRTVDFLAGYDIDLESLKAKNFVITSPKKTSDKVLFRVPAGVDLKHVVLSDAKGIYLELRAENHQDAWPGSHYHFNGEGFDEWEKTYYGHEGSEAIQEMPQYLVDLWITLQENPDNLKGKGRGATVSIGKREGGSNKTVSELVRIIMTGDAGLHDAIRDFSYGLIMDGAHPSNAIQTIQGIMQAIPSESLRYFDDVPRVVEGAARILEKQGVGDFFNKIEAVRIKGKEDAAFPRMPAFKKPEVIHLIEKQFALQSFNPIPEMQAPHADAFIAVTLNGKFLTPAYGRLPNVMGFGLAESAAGKGVNSDQVAKNLVQKYGAISNAMFDANPIDTYGPATITAQTSLVEELGSEERKNGMIWLVPEADNNLRNFETNASMKAIGATIKELFDGHDVKAVKKANSGRNTGKVPGVRMANCSLAWYSQPDVFFGVANPDNLADGLFGRYSVYFYSPTEEDERLEDELLMSGWKQPGFDENFLEFLKYTIGQCSDISFSFQVSFESGQHLTDFKKRCKREDSNLNLYLKRIFMIAEKMLTAWCGWDYLWTNYNNGQQPLDKDNELIIKEEWEIEIVKWCEYQLDLKENYVFDRIGENVAELRNVAIIEIIVELQNNRAKAAGMAGLKNDQSKLFVEKTIEEKSWVPRASVAEALRKRAILKLNNNDDRKKLINSCIEADDIPIFEEKIGKMKYLYIGELV